MLESLTVDAFRPLEGSAFLLTDAAPEPAELSLVEVRSLGEGGGGRAPFALLFRGPPGAPVYAQQTMRLRHAELGDLEIFLVPVANTPAGADYEAIFT